MSSNTLKSFSHVANFPGYMNVVRQMVHTLGKPGQRVLDMPAGNGKFSDALRADGFVVTSADINQERPDYVYTNMEAPRLPFDDHAFDWVICMEGIEHVVSPAYLVSELCRVTKPGGRVIITTPNVQNFYSRFKFLFTGVLYMFEPETTRHPRGELMDRGHISPMTLPTLCYLFDEYGLKLEQLTGDKFKRLLYAPLYALLAVINIIANANRRRKHPEVQAYHFMTHKELLLSRSLVTCWKRPTD